MKFRVIDGGRKALEDRVLENMMKGIVCEDELHRLRPWGELHLVNKNPKAASPEEPDWPSFDEILHSS